MTTEELEALKAAKWRVAGNPVRSLDDARHFLDEVGFCFLFPFPKQSSVPSLVAAWNGSKEGAPGTRVPRDEVEIREANSLSSRLVEARAAYEWPWQDQVLLVSASIFSYFYGLASDRGGHQEPPWSSGEKISPLARDTWLAIRQAERPLATTELRDQMGAGVSRTGLERALHELWARLRIARVQQDEQKGAYWTAFERWAPQAVGEGKQLSIPAALSALITKYLAGVIAADETEVEAFFSHFVGRSKVREALHALLTARELRILTVGRRTLLEVTPPPASGIPNGPAKLPPRVRSSLARSKGPGSEAQ